MVHYISIIIPVFNESSNLIAECKIIKNAMDQTNYPYEIIIIDDGSTDDTWKKIDQISFVKFIHFKKRKGDGFARKIGTLEAKGDIIVWTDCDLSYPNYIIPEMIKEALTKELDQVIGARDCETGNLKYLRRVIKWLIKEIASILTSADIPDLNSGLRVFKKELGCRYLHLLPNGFSCMATMTLSFICDGLAVGYFPAIYSERKGKSKFHPIRDTIKYVMQVIRIIVYFKIIKLN